MATKLGLYNAALGECGEPELTSLSEDRKPRHLLDSVYDDVVKYCLEQGQWKHAIRAIEANSGKSVV